jgi:penicillin-binding protein 1C
MNLALIRRQRRPQRRSGGLLALRFAVVFVSAGLFLALGAMLSVAVVVFGLYASYVQELPSAEEIGRLSVETFETTRIYDRTGQVVLYEIIPPEGGRRTWVTLDQIPEHLRNATIAMEDKTFYTNPGGINVEGVARAAWGVIRGQDEGGGSSIPQQLIRNVIMSPEERMERSYLRKLKEMILSYELTRRYPGVEGRDKILEWYLNNIFYGHFAFGVEAASQAYFGKSVEDLTLAEAAMIVPLGQSPARNPIDQPEEAKRYQGMVLDRMYIEGYITAEEAWEAKQQELQIAPVRFDIQAPHFVMYVRDILEKQYGSDAVYGGGLQVITSIDLELHKQVEQIARERIAEVRDNHNAGNAAVVVLEAPTGQILSMVGSLDYWDQSIDGQVNMATSPRQPGSSFKPFTYATAFMHGFTPASMVMDVRTSFPDLPNPEPYVPENYTRRFSGPMTLRQALAGSYNVPAVAMMHKVGVSRVVDTARAMGITTLNQPYYGLALALGAAEVPLIDMTHAFNVFANNGTMVGELTPAENVRPGNRRIDPVAILKVTDSRGNVLYEFKEPQRQSIIPAEVAYLISDILSDNQARTPIFGANSNMRIDERPVAVKTGTTNDFHDAWTVGYSPQYAVGVWVGNSDHTRMRNADGSRVAAPIWRDVIRLVHDGKPVVNFEQPAGIVTAVVDGTSGKLPTEHSQWRMQEIFIEGTVPSEYDDVHQHFQICRASGKLATNYCPLEEVEDQVFTIYPPEAEDWVRSQEIPQPPQDYCDLHGPEIEYSEVSIISPRHYSNVRGVVPVIGNADVEGQQSFWLEYGEGMNPESWTRIGPEHGHRVNNDVLEHWDTSGLNGLYTLQISVMEGGYLRQSLVPVVVDNEAPRVQIVAPVQGQRVTTQDEWISIQVNAEDNTSMSRVEFFLDDQSLGYSTVAPYTHRIPIREVPGGEHRIRVVAYDTAGNEAHSDSVTVQVAR